MEDKVTITINGRRTWSVSKRTRASSWESKTATQIMQSSIVDHSILQKPHLFIVTSDTLIRSSR